MTMKIFTQHIALVQEKQDFSLPKIPTHKINQKGQSTIEFLITFVFSTGILFLFISLGLNFTSGYLAHYATFMSSRVYLTSEQGSNDSSSTDNFAKTQTQDFFAKFKLNQFGINKSSLGNGDIFDPDNPPGNKYEYVGVKIEFDRKLNIAGFADGGQKLHLISESYIGREVVRADCKQRIWDAMGSGMAQENSVTVHITAEDNGC